MPITIRNGEHLTSSRLRAGDGTPASMSAIPLWYWATAAAVFGMAMGSFFSVLTYRWPREESLVTPRSHCTTCEHQLRWYENVPVLSWVALGRRCSSCRSPISWRYPALELVSGALAAGAIVAFGANWRGLAVLVMALALVPVVVIDLEHKLIPNIVVLPAAAIALVFAVLHDPSRWWVPVVGAAGAAAFLGVLWLVYPRGMGFGDVKLALLLGAVLGASVIPAFAIAFFAGSIIGVTLIARSGRGARKTAVPFGPFLAAGALIALWAGPTLITWYTDRLG
jgi:prepilin signal peptidase PulO-like enzyme (type II secretory pathway)